MELLGQSQQLPPSKYPDKDQFVTRHIVATRPGPHRAKSCTLNIKVPMKRILRPSAIRIVNTSWSGRMPDDRWVLTASVQHTVTTYSSKTALRMWDKRTDGNSVCVCECECVSVCVCVCVCV